MKKFFSLILALVMTASLLCSPAMAARVGTDSPNSTSTADVNIKMDPNGIIHKYCIDIDFPDEIVFTYDEGKGTWDPEDYEYEGGRNAGWSGDGDVKITNHSDMPVKYDVTPENVVNTYGELQITIGNDTGVIDACTPNTPVGSKNATAVIGIAGVPNSALTSTAVKLGVVQVVISKP